MSYLERIRKGVQKFQKRDKLAEQVVGDVTPNRLWLGKILTEGEREQLEIAYQMDGWLSLYRFRARLLRQHFGFEPDISRMGDISKGEANTLEPDENIYKNTKIQKRYPTVLAPVAYFILLHIIIHARNTCGKSA